MRNGVVGIARGDVIRLRCAARASARRPRAAGRVFMGFLLDKWYFDVVTPEGRAIILYRAELRLGLWSVGYSSSLVRGVDGRVAVSTRLTAGEPVSASASEWSWEHEPLGVRGRWQGQAAPCERELMEGMMWSCVAPAATAEVRTSEGVCRGRGYVERLVTTVPPWKMPIEDLYWGRWIGDTRSIVWIAWRGPKPLTLIVADGVVDAKAVWTPEAIELGSGERLQTRATSVLREGELGKTVLRVIPGLRRLAPRATLGVRERKWIGHGELANPARERGWMIHEHVEFGRASRGEADGMEVGA